MENWENKIIADKLNSLQDLPEGYSPNIASKWEIIQTGLQDKRKQFHRGWWIALTLLLFIGLTVWFYHPEKDLPKQQVIPTVKKEITHVQEVKLPSEKQTPEVHQQNSSGRKKQKASRDTKQPVDRPHFKPAAIRSNIRLVDSVIQIRPDTLKLSIPIADLKTHKPKRKVFQKDFEGFVSRVDSSFHKTASKGLQLKWRSNEEKLISSEEPKIRLTQKF